MEISVRDLMLAGAHFGHRVRFWHPQMAPYIHNNYQRTHIINLDITLSRLKESAEFLGRVAADGGVILFVCAKSHAADLVEEKARAAGMPFINRRWLGGLLTNFKTVRASIERLIQMEADIENGLLKELTKKEGIKFLLRKDKLEKSIGGLRNMKSPPNAIFLIDAGRHQGAVREAQVCGIPVAAIVDTNHSPENIDYVIPGNDDSRQATELYLQVISDAIIEARRIRALSDHDSSTAPVVVKTAAKPKAPAKAKSEDEDEGRDGE